jgi:hypothetical protein
VESGKLEVESWKVESGKWKVESGKLESGKLESGKWKVESGNSVQQVGENTNIHHASIKAKSSNTAPRIGAARSRADSRAPRGVCRFGGRPKFENNYQEYE